MYSQALEERYVLAAFANGSVNSRLLDIGAYHATQLSNTRCLIELGWEAALFEPSPGPMKGLLEAYGNEPRITLVQAAVGVEPGIVPMWITDDALSTGNAEAYERWRQNAAFMGKLMVPVVSLAQLSNQFGQFDMISVDAEGSSAELFIEMMRLEWEPRCVVCEHDNRIVEITQAAVDRGYVVTYASQENLVMVKR